jgi:hypothetical protein
METLICLVCKTIFNKSLLNKNKVLKDYYSCPTMNNCYNSLIEVDEGLADVVLKLNLVGARTLFSCFGHLPKRCTRPYIVFYEKSDEGKLNQLRELIIKLVVSNKYSYSVEPIVFYKNSYLPGFYDLQGDINKFVVICTNKTENALEKINMQKELLTLLYSVVEEFPKIRKKA